MEIRNPIKKRFLHRRQEWSVNIIIPAVSPETFSEKTIIHGPSRFPTKRKLPIVRAAENKPTDHNDCGPVLHQAAKCGTDYLRVCCSFASRIKNTANAEINSAIGGITTQKIVQNGISACPPMMKSKQFRAPK